MLTPKLLRLDDAVIQAIEELVREKSEKEYVSFSALTRHLIRIGLNHMDAINIPSKDRLEKMAKAEIKMQLLQSIFVSLDTDNWSMSESRPDLNIHTGHIGDTVIVITLVHPEHGEIKISGKNFI